MVEIRRPCGTAYKEALGCDDAFVPALTALCALMLHDEEYGRAEVYGQAVTSGATPAAGGPALAVPRVPPEATTQRQSERERERERETLSRV